MKKLILNIRSIDKQHKELIDIINTIKDQLYLNPNHINDITDLLPHFKILLINHFSYEERLLFEHKYPDFGKHLLQHKILINKFKEIDLIHDNKMTKCLKLIEFFEEYITIHICDDDMQFSEFLIKKGVK